MRLSQLRFRAVSLSLSRELGKTFVVLPNFANDFRVQGYHHAAQNKVPYSGR